MIRRERPVKSDDDLRSITVRDTDRRDDISQASDCNRCISLHRLTGQSLTLQVLKEKLGGAFKPGRVRSWYDARQQKPQKAGAQVTIEQIVFELVFIAAEASVARPITTVWTTLENFQRRLEHR
jgi:hypothetical protein